MNTRSPSRDGNRQRLERTGNCRVKRPRVDEQRPWLSVAVVVVNAKPNDSTSTTSNGVLDTDAVKRSANR